MKISRLIPVFALVLIFLFQCTAKHDEIKQKEKPTPQDEFQKGIVLNKVQTKTDANETFSLYLPSGYSVDKKYPVLYCFDPRARGKKPLELLKKYAEQYGYILIGSNNSKNGVPWNIIQNSIRILFNDTYNRLSIDERRVYVAGFSGGARVASSIAIEMGGVEGVLACAAGPSENVTTSKQNFNFIGFVGNEDFNYLEMNNVDRMLEKTSIPHYLVVFDGRHDWPPAEFMADAFVWFEFNAMKKGLIPKNEAVIRSFADSLSNIISNNQKKNLPINSYEQLYKKYISFIDGLIDISEYKQLYNELMNTDEMQTALKNKYELEKKENQLRSPLIEGFGTKDIKWWNAEIANLYKLSKNKNKEESLVYTRLLRFLSLASFMNANNAFAAQNLNKAELFIEIYRKVDPDNPDLDFLQAKLYAAKGDNAKALKSIEHGIKRGFDDKDKLMNDGVLNNMKIKKEFLDLVNSIKE